MSIPISEPKFPARRFVWSNLQSLPVVGPLIGTNQPPVHKQLYNILEKEFGDPILMWSGVLFGGWLELNTTQDYYTLSPIPSDGSDWSHLSQTDLHMMKKSLSLWGEENGIDILLS